MRCTAKRNSELRELQQRQEDEMVSGAQWVVPPLFPICLSLPRSLSPSHKSGSHTCVSLPPPLSRSVHPVCLPPLAFIRTVDGESRVDPLHKPRYWHADKALPYVTVNTGTYATFTECQGLASDVFYCVKKQNDPNSLMMFWKFFTGEVKGQVRVEVQGRASRVGLLNQIF